MTPQSPIYVLVTAARNEADYIEHTLKSVSAQTTLPARWIVVDDGSTDGTADIVRRYSSRHEFICLRNRPARNRRNFASKVHAVADAYRELQEEPFEYIGILDADIALPPMYYEYIVKQCRQNERLGIAGGRIIDRGHEDEVKYSSLDSVGGPVQFFRRECYESIGGYLPLRIGGEDAAAEIMARMRGWEVRTFPEVRVFHLRPTGRGMGSIPRARFYAGVENHSLGYHPLFFFLKCGIRCCQSPPVAGSLLMLAGYAWAYASRKPVLLPSETVAYLQREQKRKVRSVLGSWLPKGTLQGAIFRRWRSNERHVDRP